MSTYYVTRNSDKIKFIPRKRARYYFHEKKKKKERYHRVFHEGRLNTKLCTFDVLIIEEY